MRFAKGLCLLATFITMAGLACMPATAGEPADPSGSAALEQILAGVEERYAVEGFSAHFIHVATIKAMDIVDTASGKALFKRPGKMRWEYEKPEKQLIITNGEELWIYRPADNQVMVGRAPDFFSDGKGASFLADMRMLRKKFDIALAPAEASDQYQLKLRPQEKTYDIAEIFLGISKQTAEVQNITTFNTYGDKTLITLDQIRFETAVDDAYFQFDIPAGVDVVRMEQ